MRDYGHARQWVPECKAVFDRSYVKPRRPPTRGYAFALQTDAMMKTRLLSRVGAMVVMLALSVGPAYAAKDKPPNPQHGQSTAKASKHAKLDRSGHKQVGKASFYARKFAGRKMADGTPMKPHSNNAASKTLPLGTTARVTNKETGQSANVVIRDRGPYVRGRIIDLSPSTAQDIGITRKQGVARVEVDPITVPPPAV